MLKDNEKILIHFDTNDVKIYKLANSNITLLEHKQIFFNETLVNEELFKKINFVLEEVNNKYQELNNEKIKIYATGIFQEFSKEEQEQLRIHVYVVSGLYFNIIKPDLENFYLEKSLELTGKKDLFTGLLHQEFRKVVVCGSFQQNMKEIGAMMDCLNKRNIQVLSPWTQKIVPETVGTDFVLLEGQELVNKRDSWRHKYDHMNKFTKSDAIIVCNPNGIVGKGTLFEFGFMIANYKRIIFTEEPKNLTIAFPYEVGLNFE